MYVCILCIYVYVYVYVYIYIWWLIVQLKIVRRCDITDFTFFYFQIKNLKSKNTSTSMYIYLYICIYLWYMIPDRKIFCLFLFWNECSTLVPFRPFIRYSLSKFTLWSCLINFNCWSVFKYFKASTYYFPCSLRSQETLISSHLKNVFFSFAYCRDLFW